eukprot:GHVS01108957.1.p1 GENE.GHVS01108957.1~~GHVS01108957.1.p1  ORF type:complete len:129 (-),score=19.83 GHVS01108957.1:667-1053(-)
MYMYINIMYQVVYKLYMAKETLPPSPTCDAQPVVNNTRWFAANYFSTNYLAFASLPGYKAVPFQQMLKKHYKMRRLHKLDLYNGGCQCCPSSPTSSPLVAAESCYLHHHRRCRATPTALLPCCQSAHI